MNTSSELILALGILVAGSASTASASCILEGCEGISTPICNYHKIATTTTDVHLVTSVDPGPGCMPPISSVGTIACAALADSRTMGNLSGPCGDDSCVDIVFATPGIDSDAGNLLESPISASCSAEAMTTYGKGSATFAGGVTPTSFSCSWETLRRSACRQLTHRFFEGLQTVDYSGSGGGNVVHGGGFSTVFQPGCSSLTVSSLVDVDLRSYRIVTDTGTGCTCSGGGVASAEDLPLTETLFISSQIDYGGQTAGTIVQQGVLQVRRLDDSTFELTALGFLDDPGLVLVPDGDGGADLVGTIEMDVQLPAGANEITTDGSVDVFGVHDGDLDVNGVVCPADELIMIGLVGFALGDPEYDARADFDLDGDIDAINQAAFDVLFASAEPCECPGDTNGDGVVDVNDLTTVILGWGPCPPPPTECPGDVTGDGVVDVNDLVMVTVNWGVCDE